MTAWPVGPTSIQLTLPRLANGILHPSPRRRGAGVRFLRIYPAHLRGLGDTADGEQIRRHAEVARLLLALGVHRLEAAHHNALESPVDLVLRPEEALQVLHPLEVAHRDTASVGQDIRHNLNAARAEDVVGLRGGW